MYGAKQGPILFNAMFTIISFFPRLFSSLCHYFWVRVTIWVQVAIWRYAVWKLKGHGPISLTRVIPSDMVAWVKKKKTNKNKQKKKKKPLPRRSLNYWPSKFVLATLAKGHQMIIYVKLQSNLSIRFWEDFQRRNIHYNRKKGIAPIGASFIDGETWF